MKYKTNLLFWIILALILGIAILFIKKYISIVFLHYIAFYAYLAFILLFLFMFFLEKKYMAGQRKLKRNSALKKITQFTKLYSDDRESITIFNRQVTVKFLLNKNIIMVNGVTRTSKQIVTLEASSHIANLIDDVWDYICFYFDRTIEIIHLFHIFRANCLNISIANISDEGQKNAIIQELVSDCLAHPIIDLNPEGVLDINIASQDELSSLGIMNNHEVELIIKYRNEKGPFDNFEKLRKLLNINKARLNELAEHLYISSPVINRLKIEHTLDLV